MAFLTRLALQLPGELQTQIPTMIAPRQIPQERQQADGCGRRAFLGRGCLLSIPCDPSWQEAQ